MQDTGLHRNDQDKFYTKRKVANQCIEIFKTAVKVNKNDLIIEPAAGNCAFINLKYLANDVRFYDIQPAHPDIIQRNSLHLAFSMAGTKNKVHVVGNPPFGRQSSTARLFIKHVSTYADTIAFILPKSFKKESFQKTFPLDFHLIKQVDLPENSFYIVQGDKKIKHHVPCIFQVWVRRKEERQTPEQQDPIGYTFVKKANDPDIAIRRVGVNAGSVSTDIIDKSESTHYFIKFDTLLDNDITRLKLEFKEDNTVGPRSISKPELIKELNHVLM